MYHPSETADLAWLSKLINWTQEIWSQRAITIIANWYLTGRKTVSDCIVDRYNGSTLFVEHVLFYRYHKRGMGFTVVPYI